MKYIADGRTLDSSGISTFDTLVQAKGMWCFWLNVYQLEDDEWEKIKSELSQYQDVSNHLKNKYTPVYCK